MATVPVIKLAKPKNKKDFVIVNRDNNKDQIEDFKKKGYTEEVSVDGNELTPGAESEAPEIETEPEPAPKKTAK